MSDDPRQPWARTSGTPLVEVEAHHPLPVRSATPLEATLVDIRMPFWNMVMFMVKWTLASIPAMLILLVLWVMVLGVVGGLVGGLTSRGIPRF